MFSLLALLEFTPIVSIDVGPLSFSPHGIATAVGFVVAARVLLLPATRALGVDDDLTVQMLYRAAIGAMVGARLAYALNHWSDYADDPLSVLAVWEGGISLFGGLTGGVLAAMTVMRRERLSVWRLLDAAAPGLALGIAIGRVGDLVVADHLGRPTEFVLGFRCTGADTASRCAAPIGAGVHQPALYDMASAVVLLGVLTVLRRRRRWDGFLILVFAAGYGTARFVEDFFRIDDPVAFGLSGSQLFAATIASAAAGWLLFGRRTPAVDFVDDAASSDPESVGTRS